MAYLKVYTYLVAECETGVDEEYVEALFEPDGMIVDKRSWGFNDPFFAAKAYTEAVDCINAEAANDE
jgi:hypothetical protein